MGGLTTQVPEPAHASAVSASQHVQLDLWLQLRAEIANNWRHLGGNHNASS